MPADDKSKKKDVKDNKSEGDSDSEVKKLVQEKSEELLKKGEEFLEKSKDKLGELLDEKNRDEIKKVAQEKKDDLLKKGEKLIDQSRGILSKSKNFYEKSKDKLEKFLDEEEEEANELDGKENKPKSKKIQDETVDEVKFLDDSGEKSEETSGKQPDSESEVEGNFKHKTVKEGSERKDILKEFLNFKSSFTNSYGLLGGLIFLTVLIPFGWIEFVIDAPSFCRVFILPFPIMLFAVGYFIGVRFSLKEKKNRNWEGGAQNKPHDPAVPRKIKLSLIITFISLISLSLIYWPVSESDQGEERPRVTSLRSDIASKLRIDAADSSRLYYDFEYWSRRKKTDYSNLYGEYDVLLGNILAIAKHDSSKDYLTVNYTYHWEYFSSGSFKKRNMPVIRNISLVELREMSKGDSGFMYKTKAWKWFIRILENSGYDVEGLRSFKIN